MINFLGGTLLLVLILLLGLDLPDLDQRIPFLLQHRSIITHGFLIPLGIFLAMQQDKTRTARYLSMGVSLAMVIHLCYDLFPRAWRGYALIYTPILGRSGPVFSWFWIGVSIIICLYLAFVLIENLQDILAVLISLGIGFTVYAIRQPSSLLVSAISTLLIMGSLTLMLPAKSRKLLKDLKNVFKTS